jgi:AAA ATPase domain
MDRHANPYTPGAGARPPLLAGRDAELDDFRVAFERLGAGQFARSFMLDGLRGVGKTVLLNEADVMAREQGWISSGVVECNEDDELPLLMVRLCHRALRRLSFGKRVSSRVQRALGVLRAFTFAMDERGVWKFKIDAEAVKGVADSGDPEADIVELLAEVGAAASQHGRHSSSEIAAHMGMAQKQLSVRRAALIDKGLVYNPVGSQLDFTVPQFAAYLRRIHPFDPTQRPRRGRPRSVSGRRSQV